MITTKSKTKTYHTLVHTQRKYSHIYIVGGKICLILHLWLKQINNFFFFFQKLCIFRMYLKIYEHMYCANRRKKNHLVKKLVLSLVSVNVYGCAYMCNPQLVKRFTCTHMSINMHTHTYVYMFVCTLIYTKICMSESVYVCIYTTYIHICVC